MTYTAELADAFCAAIAPAPAPASIYEFARRVRLHDGPLAGTMLNPKAERAIDLWLQTLASRKYRWHVIVAPSQRGKTLTGVLVPTLHGLIEERVNVGWIMPNLDKLNQKWEGTIKPMVDGGGFAGYMPAKGPGSKNGRPAAMTVRDPETRRRLATLYAMALGKGGSETSTASNPCARLLIDEADDAVDAGQIKLAMKRTASYGAAGGGVVAGTVNERKGRDLHPLLEIYSEGTNSRMAHHCPHCKEYVVPELEHFVVDRAAIVCPSCAVLWSEADRHAARNAAVYRHEKPDADVFSVLYTQLDYFWEYPDQRTGQTQLALPELAKEHQAAAAAKERGDISQWNTYLRKCWCRPESADDAEVPQTVDMELAARSARSDYERCERHPDATVDTIGADNGKREAWWLGLCMAPDQRWWIRDWSRRTVPNPDPRLEPTPDDQRTMLDSLRERITRTGRANAMGIDVGYNTDLVVKWARANGFKCVRGTKPEDKSSKPTGKKSEDDNKHLPYWAEARRQDDGSLWLFLDVSAIKSEIHKSLARDPGTPGAGHLPRGQAANDWLIKHLCSERLIAGVWAKKHKDNHLLDCLVYAYALAVISLNRPKAPPRKYGVIGKAFG